MQRSSGEELSKSTLIVHAFIAEKLMNLKNLHSITSNLVARGENLLRQIWFQPVERVIKAKVVVIGSDGVEKHLEVNLRESDL